MKRIYSLYEIRNNVDGQIYVGITHNTDKRFRDHRVAARSGDPLPLPALMRAYGTERFELVVIAVTDDVRTARSLECEHVERLRAEGTPLLNVRSGGAGDLCGRGGRPGLDTALSPADVRVIESLCALTPLSNEIIGVRFRTSGATVSAVRCGEHRWQRPLTCALPSPRTVERVDRLLAGGTPIEAISRQIRVSHTYLLAHRDGLI